MFKLLNFILITGLVILAASSPAKGVEDKGPATDLTWDKLVPVDSTLSFILKKYNVTAAEVLIMKYSDPEDRKILDEVQATYHQSPVVQELDGKRVRISGYVFPLQTSNITTEFLLVPYFGACIHVPPPPANQIIYVRTKKGIANQMYLPVQVTGILKTEEISRDFTESGYSMEAIEINPIEESRDKGMRTYAH
jgi:hypothetical protein